MSLNEARLYFGLECQVLLASGESLFGIVGYTRIADIDFILVGDSARVRVEDIDDIRVLKS